MGHFILEARPGLLLVRMEEGLIMGKEEIRRRVDHLGVLNSSVVLVLVALLTEEEGVAVVGSEAVGLMVVMEEVVDPRISALIARYYKALPRVKAMASSKSRTQQLISAILPRPASPLLLLSLPLVPQVILLAVKAMVPPKVLQIVLHQLQWLYVQLGDTRWARRFV